MRLTHPTDYAILQALDEHGRNTAVNLSILINQDRQYINSELSKLRGTDLVKQIGPAKNSGLYEVTEEGIQVVEYWQSNGPIEGNHQSILE